MADKSLFESAKSFGMKRVLSYIDRDPDTNVPKLLDWLLKHDQQDGVSDVVDTVKAAVADKDNHWYRLIKSLWTDVDRGVRRTLLENAVINGAMIGTPRQKRLSKEQGCNIPWAILMDPTSACNLHCKGCWAGDYGDRFNLSYEEMDRIVQQGKQMGVHVFLFSGGEPLVRKKDIVRILEAHGDCAFLAFTNGTLIDEAFADDMLRTKNFVPAISVEGFEEETDSRRGKGVYRRVLQAMEILQRKRLLFGISCCYTSQNTQAVGSEAFFDEMIGRGAKFAWFFTYMPIGKSSVPELMASPEQREYMYQQVRQFRLSKPLFTLDFWNDGEFSNGCIAGGRSYLHINANGDIEPCAFIHYSDSNIREKTLLQAFKSPLFMEYKRNQPFNENHLRPCPLLDNPPALARMVERSGARSTDFEHPEPAADLCEKCVDAAERWKPFADKLWEAGHAISRMNR